MAEILAKLSFAITWKKEIVSARCTVMQLRRFSRNVLTLLPGFFLLLIGQGKRRELLTAELLNKKEAGLDDLGNAQPLQKQKTLNLRTVSKALSAVQRSRGKDEGVTI